MAILITGPSSVGKSTFLTSPECRRFGVDDAQQIVFGSRIAEGSFSPDALIHYNLLHGALKFRSNLSGLRNDWDFRGEPVFEKIVASGLIERCVVLVAPLAELLERMLSRTVVELAHPEPYNATLWREITGRIDLHRVYEALFAVLDRLVIPYRVVFSSCRRPEKFAASTRAFIPENLEGRFVW